MSESAAKEALAFLESHRRIFVLTKRRDGWPTIHPMGGAWRDGALLVNTYRKSQKVVNAQRSPRISYLVTSQDDEAPFGAVNVRGRASVMDPVPGWPSDLPGLQRTGFDRPLRVGEVAKRILLKLDPERVDVIR